MSIHPTRIALAAFAVIVLAPLAASAACETSTVHAVNGTGETDTRMQVALRGVATRPAPSTNLYGIAQLSRPSRPTVSVNLDCIEVGEAFQPKWIRIGPAHGVYASGLGSDGRRWYIALNDEFTTGDSIAVTMTKGTGPCGSSPRKATPIRTGDYVVAGG